MLVQGVAQHVEFLYTDISAQLVGYGRKTYGAKYPFARFKVLVRHSLASTSGCQAFSGDAQSGFSRASWRSELAARPKTGAGISPGRLHTDLRVDMRRCAQVLDVEKDVAGEGIGSFDILFAANVLHATSNMTNTLQHCKVSRLQYIRVISRVKFVAIISRMRP